VVQKFIAKLTKNQANREQSVRIKIPLENGLVKPASIEYELMKGDKLKPSTIPATRNPN
jgi:hypothetical protein